MRRNFVCLRGIVRALVCVGCCFILFTGPAQAVFSVIDTTACRDVGTVLKFQPSAHSGGDVLFENDILYATNTSQPLLFFNGALEIDDFPNITKILSDMFQKYRSVQVDDGKSIIFTMSAEIDCDHASETYTENTPEIPIDDEQPTYMRRLAQYGAGGGGTMETTVEGTTEPAVEGTPEPGVEVTAEPAVEGTPEPAVEGTTESVVEVTAEPAVEGTTESVVEDTPEPPVEGTPAATDDTDDTRYEDVMPVPNLEQIQIQIIRGTTQPAIESTPQPAVGTTPPGTEDTDYPAVIDGAGGFDVANVTDDMGYTDAMAVTGLSALRLHAIETDFRLGNFDDNFVDRTNSGIELLECVFYREHDKKYIACVAVLKYNTCIYYTPDAMMSTDGLRRWQANFIALILGHGSVHLHLDSTGDSGGNGHEHGCIPTNNKEIVKGFEFPKCLETDIFECIGSVEMCSSKNLGMMLKHHAEQYDFQISANPNIVQREMRSAIVSITKHPTRSNRYFVTRKVVEIASNMLSSSMLSREDVTDDRLAYLLGTNVRQCPVGLVHGVFMVAQQSYFSQFACNPCTMNHYYAEENSAETKTPSSITADETLFLDLHLHDDGFRVVLLNNRNMSSGLPSSNLMAIRFRTQAVASGSNVHIHIGPGLQYRAARGSAMESVSTEDGSIIHIKIKEIGALDALDDDAPIFIDVVRVSQTHTLSPSISDASVSEITAPRGHFVINWPSPDHPVSISDRNEGTDSILPFHVHVNNETQQTSFTVPSYMRRMVFFSFMQDEWTHIRMTEQPYLEHANMKTEFNITIGAGEGIYVVRNQTIYLLWLSGDSPVRLSTAHFVSRGNLKYEQDHVLNRTVFTVPPDFSEQLFYHFVTIIDNRTAIETHEIYVVRGLAEIAPAAILPMRHAVKQVCTQCPTGSFSGRFGARDKSVCRPMPWARKALSTSARETIVNTMGGFLIQNMEYENNVLEVVLAADEASVRSRQQEIEQNMGDMIGIDKNGTTQIRITRIFALTAATAQRRSLLQNAGAVPGQQVQVTFKLSDRVIASNETATPLLAKSNNTAVGLIVLYIVLAVAAISTVSVVVWYYGCRRSAPRYYPAYATPPYQTFAPNGQVPYGAPWNSNPYAYPQGAYPTY